ncbi:MAG TPA: hypothetical protein VF533_25705 [Solirubrobacteraceae bacterium]|jgi:hypothetical protein
MRRALLLAALALVPAATAVAVAEGGEGRDLAAARAATARFHHGHPGYALLRDAAGIACIDKPGEGGMGVHYVNGDLVGDGEVDALHPDVLVYEPDRHGRGSLVAAEYVVFQDAWAARHGSAPPRLFGRDFELVEVGNRYGLPPFYELHAWLFKHNPSGMFGDWNPRVTCPA